MDVRSDLAAVRQRPKRPSPLSNTRLADSRFVSPEERDALEGAVSSSQSIGPNIDLVREGDRADSLFIITAGWACRYMTRRNGARHLPALLLPGDVGNLDSLMFDRPGYGLRTLTQASIVTLSRDCALALAAEHPGIARMFTWLALVENAILRNWSMSLGRRSSKERLAHLLCELGARLEERGTRPCSFALPLTQEQLGDALGLTAVHVNRTMRDLRNEGLLTLESRTVTLLDVERLRRTAGFDPVYLHRAPPAQG